MSPSSGFDRVYSYLQESGKILTRLDNPNVITIQKGITFKVIF